MEPLGKIVERVEVIGGERFALQHGEIDFDLVEPAGVDRGMHQQEVGVALAEPPDRGQSAMRGAVVDDPEDAPSVAVGRLLHDLVDEALERGDAGLGFAAAEQLGTMDIAGGEVGLGGEGFVFVLDVGGLAGFGGRCGMPALTRLDGGFLVGRDDAIGLVQGSTQPSAVIEVEDATGLVGEVGVAREDPAAVLPRADGVVMQQAPDGGFADAGSDAAGAGGADEIVEAPAGQGQVVPGGGLPSQGAHLHDEFRGGEARGVRGAGVPRDRPSGVRRSACARG